MAQALFAGMRDLEDIPAEARVGDWGDRILYSYRDIYIFTAITSRLKREVVDDPEFNEFESDAPPMRAFLNMSGGASDSATQLTISSPRFTSPAYMFTKNTIVRVGDSPVSGELLRVTADPSDPAVITVQRGWGGTTAAAIANGTALTIMGSVSADGAGAPVAQGIEPYKVTNRCQIFRDAYSIDRTLDATKTRWREQERLRRKEEALRRHLLKREMTCLFGHGYSEPDADVGTYRRTTKGIASFLSSNVLDGSGDDFTYEAFKEWALPMSDTGRPTKVGFVGGLLFQAIQNMAERNSTVMLTPGETRWGIRILHLQTAGPDFELVKHPLLTKYYPGTGLFLDLSLITVCTMRDEEGVRDMRYRHNIQLPDEDAVKGEFLSHIGIKLGLEAAHGIIHGVTTYTHA